MSKSRLCLLILVLLVAGLPGDVARASGPHWVAGVNFFDPSVKGQPVVWAGGQVRYYLDQGALSSTMSNSQAAALVASAAAVWSAVPTAAVAIAQGGSLSEDVNGSNVTANTPSGTGAVLPADASPSATNMPLAVVLDADGSVIDDEYGPGASDPSSCTQNGVFSRVDAFSPAGNIAHALILVNGRCASSTALNGLLLYELVRAFGRVLGLDWSQVNETMWQSGVTTTEGLAGWPVMHALERLCSGSMTSCLPNPTTLRPDDIAGLNQLYPVTAANQGSWSGKTLTSGATITVEGTITFRNGQGMQGVNVVLTPLTATANGPVPDLRYTVSAVSGAYFRVNAPNAVMGPGDAAGNAYGRFGTDDTAKEGFFILSGVPLPAGATSAMYQLSIEPIDALYTGAQAVGPYGMNQVTPSGAMQTVVLGTLSAGASVTQNFVMRDSADGTQTDDGVETKPNSAAGNGEWIAKLVGYGHAGWFEFHARANRTFTVEAASLDEVGLGTESKSAVLIGMWNGSDAVGALPDMATTVPFNGAGVGLSTLSAQTVADGQVRLAYADMRGDGRPDFTYRARVLYADSVFPSRLPLGGGTMVIRGQGFRAGTQVSVNGAAAAVMSVSPTEITAAAPAVSAPTGTVVLTVEDPQTLGTASILDGLSYDAQGTDALRMVAAPSGTVSQGVPVPMTVQVVAGDGVMPAPGVQVSFVLVQGAATMSCMATPCTALSNGDGLATVMVTPTSATATEIRASLSTGASVTAEFDSGVPPQIAAVNTLHVAAGAQASWTPTAILLNGGTPVQGAQVGWTGSSGAQVQAPSSTSNAAGMASVGVLAGPLAAGATASVYACEQTPGVCATFTIAAVHAETAMLLPVSGVGQSLSASSTPMAVTLEVIDGAGQPLAGAQVTVAQQMTAWEPPCPALGRCPTPQVLGASTATLTADANGLVAVTPLSGGGQPVNIAILATTGQSGSLLASITQHP